MAKTVAIYLEFDHDDVDDAEVYNYLNELMENGILNWETEGGSTYSEKMQDNLEPIEDDEDEHS